MSIKELKGKVIDLKSNLIQKYYKRKVKHKHLLNFYYRLEENKILQQYITKKILDGQVKRREELIEKQGEEKELIAYINFIKRI